MARAVHPYCGRRPKRFQHFGHSEDRAYSASGCAGLARSKAGGEAGLVDGADARAGLEGHLEALALATCGTRQTSAIVGVSPKQKRPVRARELRLERVEALADPVRYHVVARGSSSRAPRGTASTRSVVERMDVAGDRERDRAHPGAVLGARRQERRRGCFSSRYSMIASDCVSAARRRRASAPGPGDSARGMRRRAARPCAGGSSGARPRGP
jgi:hypothetical protein